MIRPLMTPSEARRVLALFAKAKGVEPRIIQDEAERRKVQRANGIPVNIGDEYISLEDVKLA